jgi:hypothetical protein
MNEENFHEYLRELAKSLEKENSIKINFIKDVKVVGKSNVSHKIDFLIFTKDKNVYIKNVSSTEWEKEAIRATVEAIDIGSKIYLVTKKKDLDLNEINKKVNNNFIEFVSIDELKGKISKNIL